jgi:hypothetical protein
VYARPALRLALCLVLPALVGGSLGVGAAWAADPEAPLAADALIPPVPTAPLDFRWPVERDPAEGAVIVDVTLQVAVSGAVADVAVVGVRAEGASVVLDADDPRFGYWAGYVTALCRQIDFVPASEGGAPVAVDVPLTIVLRPPRSAVADDSAVAVIDAAPEGLTAAYDKVRAEVIRRVLTADDLRTTPGTMGDPLRAITNLPGAVRTPLDSGWLLVRGGDPRDTGVYIDGVRVPLIYHLGGFTSVVHPAFIDHVDFTPGGQSSRYGRSTAGVVDLVTTRSEAASSRVEARAGANIVLAGAFVSVPTPVGGFALGLRRSYLDAVLQGVPTISAEQAAIAPRFWDWQLRADVRVPAQLRLFAFGFTDTVDGSTANGERVLVAYKSQQIQGDWQGFVLGKPAIVRPYFSYEQREVTISALSRQQDRRMVGLGMRAELQDDGQGAIGGSTGLDLRMDQLQLAYNGIDRQGWVGSPELYGDLRLGHATRAVLGVRTDAALVSDQLPRLSLSPRLSVVHPVSDGVDLRMDAGVYHQAPPAELLLGPPEGAALRLEYSWGAGIGASWRSGPFSVDADAYGRRIVNLTQFEADGSLGQGDGLAFGVETLSKLTLDRFSGWLSLSWSRSVRREEPDQAWAPSVYDQPLTLVLVGSEALGRGWTLSGRFRYGSGFPAPTAPDAVAVDVLRSVSVPLVADRRGRLPDFHALDVKISRHLVKRALGVDLYLDVQNVYNRRIPEPVITGLADVYAGQTYGFGLPVLPIIGVEGVYR